MRVGEECQKCDFNAAIFPVTLLMCNFAALLNCVPCALTLLKRPKANLILGVIKNNVGDLFDDLEIYTVFTLFGYIFRMWGGK